MPSKLKTVCCHPRSPPTVGGRYCDEHRGGASYRVSDRRRVTPTQQGYDAAWRSLRRLYISQHPYCEDRREEGGIGTGHLEVDHIIPIDVRPPLLSLDMKNLQIRRRQYHKRKAYEDKTEEYNRRRGANAERCRRNQKDTGVLMKVSMWLQPRAMHDVSKYESSHKKPPTDSADGFLPRRFKVVNQAACCRLCRQP